MSTRSVIVLGGGLGGVTAAIRLRRLLPAEHRVVLVEQRPTFSLPMANLWLMTGERRDRSEGERPLSELSKHGIEVVQAQVESIDPETKRVGTSAGTLDGDHLVVALGAAKAPQALPGFVESALNIYDTDGAMRIREALDEFAGGRIVVLVSRTPFSCPSAPYEAALLVDAKLRDRGVRERTEIAVYTPEDVPMLAAGEHVGQAVVDMLKERGIKFHREQIAMKIDPVRRRILFEVEDASFDLLLGVPAHVAPAVARESGLTDASGWIPVDATTLKTCHAGVYAIGDVTAVRLANGMFLPKAGVFADGEASIVAAAIASEMGAGAPPPQYDGRGFCFIEVGGGKAAYGAGNFYGIPGPRVTLDAPTEAYRREKLDTERTALALWE
jgi:sulfide:quinone oxidoreductase